MAAYRISGVWKDGNTIVAYAFHEVSDDGVALATKKTKAQAIALLETRGNTATTWLWNYATASWRIGETVRVINGPQGKYLRSDPDNQLTDNLGHLIDYDWIRL